MTDPTDMSAGEALDYESRYVSPHQSRHHLATAALAAEVRACHATIRRMVAEREALEVELAKWRR